MLKYKIEITGKKHPMPVVKFEDEGYALAATFLLAEARSFGREILAELDKVCLDGASAAGFSGNAFSLEIGPDTTKVVDDIMGDECEVPTREMKKLVEEYRKAYKDCGK